MRPIRAIIAALILSGFLAGSRAWAAGPSAEDLKSDPADKWHVISWDPAITTSQCIGNPVTPRCALETFKAGAARLNSSYTLAVTGKKISLPTNAVSVWYRIISETVVSAKTARRELKPPEQAGDIRLITEEKFCVKDREPCPFPEIEEAIYVLRRTQDGHWSILGWCVGNCD